MVKSTKAPHLVEVFTPIGYRLRCQASIIANGKVRKKRADASIESFDPSTDGILLTFEPEFEIEDEPESAPAGRTRTIGPYSLSPAVVRPPAYAAHPEQIRAIVLALHRAEATQHQFVGLKYFRDKLLPRESAAWVTDDLLRRQVLKELIDQSLIETGKVPNPQSAEFPVTSIKLNRAHPKVEEILRSAPAAIISEFRPVRQTGELASRVILKDRR
ncbi:MAG: hypothetical protein ABI972_24635 [Acidobacteriota bacterium]